MKNCTKLHFYRVNNGETYHKEDFFLGGALIYETGLIKYAETDTDVVWTLVTDDMVFIDTNPKHLITKTVIENDEPVTKTYAPILPIYDIYSLKQNLECRCSIIRGELFYDVRHGIPLKATLSEKRLCILNIINKTPSVTRTKVLSEKIQNRKYTIDVEITSDFGTFVINMA